MLVLADPEFSGMQCSPDSLSMRWRAAPSIELQLLVFRDAYGENWLHILYLQDYFK